MLAYKSNLKARPGAALLVIDPQVDFHPGGSLAIPTANEDAKRTADFIRKHINEIDEVYVTLDTHQHFHIAHPYVSFLVVVICNLF